MTYDRSKAIAYAHQWAFLRNPRFGVFDEMGGDCTNFISQCLYAGCGVMNYTKTTGWYYKTLNDRAPAWTGVKYLERFLTRNQGRGPYGEVLPLEYAVPGDVVQIAFDSAGFTHSVLIVAIEKTPEPYNILVAAHNIDSNNRRLSSYFYHSLRLIHIVGARS